MLRDLQVLQLTARDPTSGQHEVGRSPRPRRLNAGVQARDLRDVVPPPLGAGESPTLLPILDEAQTSRRTPFGVRVLLRLVPSSAHPVLLGTSAVANGLDQGVHRRYRDPLARTRDVAPRAPRALRLLLFLPSSPEPCHAWPVSAWAKRHRGKALVYGPEDVRLVLFSCVAPGPLASRWTGKRTFAGYYFLLRRTSRWPPWVRHHRQVRLVRRRWSW
jgi:hypothetical protein